MRDFIRNGGLCLLGLWGYAGCASDVEPKHVGALSENLSAAGTTLSFCDADQQDTLRSDNERAFEITYAAYQAFDANPDGELAVRWFGHTAGDDSAKQQVDYILYGAALRFNTYSTPIRCDCRQQSVIASTDNAHPENGMSVCTPAYWNLNQVSAMSRAGTIAHEVTHWFNTQDYTDVNVINGIAQSDAARQDAMDLAVSNPNEARNNAISFQFFIEENALGL